MTQTPPPPKKPHERWKVALAALALLVSIVACAQLVQFDDVDRATRPTAATPVPAGGVPPGSRPTAVQLPTPYPTPISVPTGVTPMPLPDPAFGSTAQAAVVTPTPTPIPQSPEASIWKIVDSHLAGVADTGVWTATAFRSGEVFHPIGTELTLMPRCHAGTNNQLISVASDGATGRSTTVRFDLEQQAWYRGGTLPSSPIDEQYDNCAVTATGRRFIIATSTDEALVLMISDDTGQTFKKRTLVFPNDWSEVDEVVETNVSTVTVHNGDLIISMCATYSYDFSCPQHLLRIELSRVLDVSSETLSWQDIGGQVIHPSEVYAGSYLDFFSGAALDNDAVDIVQLGDETWRMERYNTVSEAYFDYSFEQGSWSAAPLDAPPALLPRGLRPQLFAYDNTAVAAVPLAALPQTSSRARYYTTVEWWTYDRTTGDWVELRLPPTVAPYSSSFTEPGRFDGSVYLSSVGHGVQLQLIPRTPIQPTWETVVGDAGAPLVAGGRMHMIDDQALWISQDRGITWQPTAYTDGQRDWLQHRCRTEAEGNAAFVLRDWAFGRDLIIGSPTGSRAISLPRRANPVGAATRPISPCKPLRLDDAWHVAHLEGEGDMLVVQSVLDDGHIIERTIDLTGTWADAVPRSRGYAGAVDLYRHGDRVIVHICTVDEGAQCAFTDLSFDRSLLVGSQIRFSAADEAAATPARFYPPNDHEFGAAEQLFQLGDQVWRSDHDQVAGDCACAEGGGLAPYFTWVGGPFDGRAEAGSTRTVDYRLFNGQVTRCGSDAIPSTAQVRSDADFVEPNTEQRCQTRDANNNWQPVFGPVAVDWATVPAGTAVTFVERDDQGRILVTPTGG